MNLVVMKFGGTSVEDAAAMDRTADIVAGRVARGLQPWSSSARWRKVTDQLLAAAAAAGRGDKAGALAISVAPARTVISDGQRTDCRAGELAPISRIHRRAVSMHSTICCAALPPCGELTPRTNDLVVSFGERLSSRMVAAAFWQRGLNGAHVDARDLHHYRRALRQGRAAGRADRASACGTSCCR